MPTEPTIDPAEYLSIEEAARTSKLHEAYIRQLCRTGKVLGRREGKNWYVNNQSLVSFLREQNNAKTSRRELLAHKRSTEYKKLNTGGTAPVSVEQAAYELGLEETYVRQLCRDGKVIAERVGGNWCINRESLASLLVTQSYQQAIRREILSRERADEYLRKNNLKRGTRFLNVDQSEALFRIKHLFLDSAWSMTTRFAVITVVLLITLGTYFLVNPDAASYAAGAVKNAKSAFITTYYSLKNNEPGNIVDRAGSQLAAVASDPALLIDLFSRLARSWNYTVNSYVYSLTFPRPMTESSSVVAKVTTRPKPPASASPSRQTPVTYPGGSTTIINQPVIERIIERQLLASQGGITEEILNARIEALDAALSNKIYSLSSAQTTVINNTYETLGAVARGDNFDDINIDDSDITDSRWSGGTVDATTLTVSGAPTLTSLTASGDASIGGNLTVTGSLTVSGAQTLSGAITIPYLNATST